MRRPLAAAILAVSAVLVGAACAKRVAVPVPEAEDYVFPEPSAGELPAGDAKALRVAWADVLADVEDRPELWRRYGRQARRTWSSRFSRAANVQRLLEVYRFAVDHPLGQLGSGSGIPGRPERSSCQERPVRQ